MTGSSPEGLPQKQEKLFRRAGVFPDQLLICGAAVKIIAFPIPFSGNSSIWMANYLAVYIVKRIELVTTRSRDKIENRPVVRVLPDSCWGCLRGQVLDLLLQAINTAFLCILLFFFFVAPRTQGGENCETDNHEPNHNRY